LKYNINARNNFKDTILFWIQKFLYDSAVSSKGRFVENHVAYDMVLRQLSISDSFENMKEIEKIIKQLYRLNNKGIYSYYAPLKHLYYYLLNKNISKIQYIDSKMIKSFINELQLNSEVTRDNYKQTIVRFLNFINDNNEDLNGFSFHFEINLSQIKVNIPKKLPVFLNKNELEIFMKANDTIQYDKKSALMNSLLIKFLLYTGIRTDELINIKITDIVLDKNIYKIKVLGKGNKERIVKVEKDLIYEHLQKWLKKRKTRKNNYLFVSSTNTKLISKYVYNAVQAVLQEANIKKEKSGGHLLRHTFATHLYNKTKDLLLVKQALGHDSLSSTQIYTHLDW
jgi:integrase/recombinase XerD